MVRESCYSWGVGKDWKRIARYRRDKEVFLNLERDV